jgi:hypothetical protein
MKNFIIIIIISLLFLIACENSQTPDTEPPDEVVWVEKTPDIAAEERGIDAVPDEDGIFLHWYKLQDRNVRYYNIYRQNENEAFFSRIRQIDIESATAGRDTTYIDSDVLLNSFNYYYITAENSDGIQGLSSDTIRYKLYDKAETSQPFGNVSGIPTFFWTFITVLPDSFILRIEEDFPPYELHFVRKFQSNYDNFAQVLDLSAVPDPPEFGDDRSYKWRIDAIGIPDTSCGSESQYLQFRFN